MANEIRIIPITSIDEISGGDNLSKIIGSSLKGQRLSLMTHDVFVVTQKIVSKAEGRLVRLETIKPSLFALSIAKQYGKDPRHIEIILQQTKRIVRMDQGILICQTHHGFVCANAGVDASNIVGEKVVSLLPVDPDKSAKQLREDLIKNIKSKDKQLAVIISDTWGRPWREGQINVAIGSAGLEPIIDYRGKKDMHGKTLQVTAIAIADELAGAAELAMNKFDNVPGVLIRGYNYIPSNNNAQVLLRKTEFDLFR